MHVKTDSFMQIYKIFVGQYFGGFGRLLSGLCSRFPLSGHLNDTQHFDICRLKVTLHVLCLLFGDAYSVVNPRTIFNPWTMYDVWAVKSIIRFCLM